MTDKLTTEELITVIQNSLELADREPIGFMLLFTDGYEGNTAPGHTFVEFLAALTIGQHSAIQEFIANGGEVTPNA